jgi:hypothetical protein
LTTNVLQRQQQQQHVSNCTSSSSSATPFEGLYKYKNNNNNRISHDDDDDDDDDWKQRLVQVYRENTTSVQDLVARKQALKGAVPFNLPFNLRKRGAALTCLESSPLSRRSYNTQQEPPATAKDTLR